MAFSPFSYPRNTPESSVRNQIRIAVATNVNNLQELSLGILGSSVREQVFSMSNQMHDVPD